MQIALWFLGGPANGEQRKFPSIDFRVGKAIEVSWMGHIYKSGTPWNGIDHQVPVDDRGLMGEPIILNN